MNQRKQTHLLRLSHLVMLSSLLSFFLFACQQNQLQVKPIVEQSSTTQASIQLGQTVENYSQQSLRFNPLRATVIGVDGFNDKFYPALTKSNRNARLSFEKKFLKQIEAIPVAGLSGQDKLTYAIFLRDRQMAIESFQFKSYMLPLNQMYGMHNVFAELTSANSSQPFNTEADYLNYLKRAEGFSQWMDSAIEAMRAGINQGVVQPQIIVEKVLPQLRAQLIKYSATADLSNSLFYQPIKNLPENLKQNTKLVEKFERSIRQQIIPTYEKMYHFLKREYLPKARQSVGLSELPMGKNWYQFMIKTHTTLPLQADEIHQYGRQEVARILAEMKKVKQQVNFPGDLPSFFNFLRTDDQFYFKSEAELISAYQNIQTKIDATLPLLFNVFPKANYQVRPVPAFRAASSAGASYQSPAVDGSRPGIFYINSYNLKSQPKFLTETLSIHEASPGHHFQIAIQQEVKNLPNYRKFGGYTVFSEGWALYAESLGKELGLFTDPYMWYGRLVDEQLRAMRLVVDTGLHAKGWSRQQAIDYMLVNSSMAESDVTAEVERYIVIPGQALAYKIGQRTIRELRQIGEKILGDQFNIKEFHKQILIDGALPMPVLRTKMMQWFEQQKQDQL
jgi:uncharacterized protein (DUF885 family)